MKQPFLLGLIFTLLTPFLTAAPVSFLYDGEKADLTAFSAQSSQKESGAFTEVTTRYTAPDGKLAVTIDEKTYKNFPIHEYSVKLENLSASESTGIIESFKSLDTALSIEGQTGSAVTLNAVRGSTCCPEDFIPLVFPLTADAVQSFRTPSGRSSNDLIPYIEANWDDQNGYLVAVGWTGAWSADFTPHGSALQVTAGMDKTHFRLLPGESIRQPSILIARRENCSRRQFKTMFHRFMVDEKMPRDASGRTFGPIFPITAGGGNKTPQMMLDILQYKLDNDLALDTYWIDAGWYGEPHEDEHYSNCGPDWYKYVGDWRFNTTTHPTGDLLPIADAVHAAGMKFLLWFEPERMTENAPILKEHPEYANGPLVNYGNPEALTWIQETIYGIIEKHHIDIYRQDFNMEPGPVWAEMDKADPDRVGIAEARHVTGLYQFLDQMRERFPWICQENCASGGRRLDMEMASRAFAYCRSDYYIGQKPGDTAIICSQNGTLNMIPYLPVQGSETNCAPTFDDYAMASCFATGGVFTPTDFDGGIVRRPFTDAETKWFKKWFALGKRMGDYALTDFYQLTDETGTEDTVWCGWQYNDPQDNSGFAIVFRRADTPEETKTLELAGIDPNAEYTIETFSGVKSDENETGWNVETAAVRGSELAQWTVSAPKRSFTLVFYKKAN